MGGFFLLGVLAQHILCGDKQAGHGGRILDGEAHHLGGVDDPGGHEVFIDAGFSVVANGAFLGLDVFRHHGANYNPRIRRTATGLSHPSDGPQDGRGLS